MLEVLLGNTTAEKALMYLQNYNEGSASDISKTFGTSLSMVQKQLIRLEQGGVLVSVTKGRTRLYLWNPRYVFLKEIKALLDKALSCLSQEEVKKYYRKRQRPRKTGKPI